jgi:hypothetical protein
VLCLAAGSQGTPTIYDTISATADKFEDTKTKLNNYFKPMKDTAMAVFLFRETMQKAGEM